MPERHNIALIIETANRHLTEGPAVENKKCTNQPKISGGDQPPAPALSPNDKSENTLRSTAPSSKAQFRASCGRTRISHAQTAQHRPNHRTSNVHLTEGPAVENKKCTNEPKISGGDQSPASALSQNGKSGNRVSPSLSGLPPPRPKHNFAHLAGRKDLPCPNGPTSPSLSNLPAGIKRNENKKCTNEPNISGSDQPTRPCPNSTITTLVLESARKHLTRGRPAKNKKMHERTQHLHESNGGRHHRT
jgi:hypothetical protein